MLRRALPLRRLLSSNKPEHEPEPSVFTKVAMGAASAAGIAGIVSGAAAISSSVLGGGGRKVE
jgi:hypothetical protein